MCTLIERESCHSSSKSRLTGLRAWAMRRATSATWVMLLYAVICWLQSTGVLVSLPRTRVMPLQDPPLTPAIALLAQDLTLSKVTFVGNWLPSDLLACTSLTALWLRECYGSNSHRYSEAPRRRISAEPSGALPG